MLSVAVTTTSPKISLKTVVRTWRWAREGSRDLPVFAPDIESNKQERQLEVLMSENGMGVPGVQARYSCLRVVVQEGVAFRIC